MATTSKPFDGVVPVVYGLTKVDGHVVYLGTRQEKGHIWQFHSASNRPGNNGEVWDPGADPYDFLVAPGSTSSSIKLLNPGSYTTDGYPLKVAKSSPYVFFRGLNQVRKQADSTIARAAASINVIVLETPTSGTPTTYELLTVGTPVLGPYASACYAICEAPVVGIPRIFKDGKPISSASALVLTTIGNPTCSFVTGTSTAWSGFLGDAAGMTMTGTVQFRADALSIPNGKAPTLSFEVSGALGHPADVVVDLLTHPFHGAGLTSDQVVVETGSDGSTSSSYRTYCTAMGWTRVSRAIAQRSQGASLLESLLLETNSTAVWSEGKLKIIPQGDTNTGSFVAPTASIAIGVDDLIAEGTDDPIQISRRPDSEVFNTFPVAFTDRWAEYSEVVIEYIEPGHSALIGVRRAPKTSAYWIDTQAHAMALSTVLAQRSIGLRNTYRFKLGPRWALLEPMDFITLTEPTLGLSSTNCRILTVDESEDGVLTIEAVQWDTGVVVPVNVATQTYDGYSAAGYISPAESVALAATTAASASADPLLTNVGQGAVTSLILDGPSRHDYTTLWGNPTSEIDPVDEVAASGSPDYVNRYNAGASAFAGQWVRQLSASAGSTASMSSYDIPAIPGETYYISVKAKASSSYGNGYTVLSALNASGTVLVSQSSPSVTGSSWTTTKNLSFVIPSSGTAVRASMVSAGSGSSGSVVWFDGITFARSGDTDALSVAASGGVTYAEGSCISAGACTATSNTVTVTAAGGSPSYSYLWQLVAGTSMSLSSPTSAATSWSKTGTAAVFRSTYRCKVTDSEGTIAYSPNVTVYLECATNL